MRDINISDARFASNHAALLDQGDRVMQHMVVGRQFDKTLRDQVFKQVPTFAICRTVLRRNGTFQNYNQKFRLEK